MSQAAQAFAEFLIEKCRRELAGECQPQAPRILHEISIETLAQIYGYHDCPEWERYVINLDGDIAPETFFHENPLYRHTPRIFKAGAAFGIEHLQRTRPYADELRGTVKQAVDFTVQQGIAIVYQKSNPADGVFIIEERDQVKVKFAYFTLRTEGGGNG